MYIVYTIYNEIKAAGQTAKELRMKEYEIKVFAGYKCGGEKYYNCFKEYVTAKTETEAKKLLKAELKNQGYIDIKLTEAIPC